jgi:hypothetical protein
MTTAASGNSGRSSRRNWLAWGVEYFPSQANYVAARLGPGAVARALDGPERTVAGVGQRGLA